MSCCTCCCFYPKYKRKVDSIYPRSYEGNLIKNEIDKLQYYSCQHPEKLSKIGDYLYQNLKWGLNGRYRNKNYVRNTIEAVDKILIVIGCEYLNFYANSYLKMIQKLLEQIDLDYQKMATNSFKKFCEKESNQTTNYNRNYDQFVCQFSAMCYNNHKEAPIRSEIRISGLQGIGAMVKKLQPDESLQATYLWDNMDKIVSSLLFIMQESFNERSSVGNYLTQNIIRQPLTGSVSQLTQPEGDLVSKLGAINDDATITINNESSMVAPSNNTLQMDRIKLQVNNTDDENIEMRLLSSENLDTGTSLTASPPPIYETDFISTRPQQDPSYEAKQLLKEISSKADYITITRIVRPLLTYLDTNNAWQQLDFIECVFKTVMYNVKQQHAIIIKELIKHLDSHRNSEATMKRFIIKAISICIQISALNSVGTTANIIDIFTNLLKHLNFSLEKSFNSLSEVNNREEEIKFQNEILATMVEFTSQLPDYAKNDVITFITRQMTSHQYTYNELQQQQQEQQQQDRRVANLKEQLNEQMRGKYLDALYEICSNYKPMQVFGAFTNVVFLEDILRLTLMFDPASRRKSCEILHYLLDKHSVLNRIKQFQKRIGGGIMFDLFDYDLKPSKEDIHFMKKNGKLFLSHLNESLFIRSNSKQNFENIFITMLLFLMGINDKEFLIDLIAFGLHIQYLTLVNYKELSFSLKCEIMSFLTAYFDLIARLNVNFNGLNQYINKIIGIRKSQYYYKYLMASYVYQMAGGNKSASLNSLNKLNETSNENDFNSEFDDIAKEYIDLNKDLQEKQQMQDKNDDENTSLSSKNTTESVNDDESVKSKIKMKSKTSWLFDKQVIIELLLKSGKSNFYSKGGTLSTFFFFF
jgi:hypothetical protein